MVNPGLIERTHFMRSRNDNGRYRQKRSDTNVGTVEKEYGLNFGVRSDMHLGTLLEELGEKSLNDLITGK